MDTHRRHTLGLLLASTASTVAATASLRTPRAAEGPFYPTEAMRYSDRDNDLVRRRARVRDAGGEVLHLRGRVLDRSGQPIAGARVEIWQCDVNGRYLHTGDRGGRPRDPDFQGFGFDLTDAEGHYRFRTLKPVAYPGRTPHIHVKVLDGQRALLTTQFYLADHPDNARDGLYRRLDADQVAAVSMRLTPVDADHETVVNITV
ncbi:MAG: protocatechuate 3,4-dioxygenase [Pseudomonadota bacterium]